MKRHVLAAMRLIERTKAHELELAQASFWFSLDFFYRLNLSAGLKTAAATRDRIVPSATRSPLGRPRYPCAESAPDGWLDQVCNGGLELRRLFARYGDWRQVGPEVFGGVRCCVASSRLLCDSLTSLQV